MSMPKTTIHENREPLPPEGEVWLSWQVDPVKSKAKSGLMNRPPDSKLRGGILASNASHILTALLSCQSVDHLALEELLWMRPQ